MRRITKTTVREKSEGRKTLLFRRDDFARSCFLGLRRPARNHGRTRGLGLNTKRELPRSLRFCSE